MKKQTISISELTQQILHKRKIKSLLESVAGMASSVQSQVMNLGKELKKAGEDITDEEVQGAMLMAALDDKGKIEKVEPEEVKALVDQIRESRGYRISESGGLLHVIEVAGSILGNVALLNVIAATIEKATGKKVNPGILRSTINEMTASLKEVTGLPAKAIEKFFSVITKLFGGGEAAQKIAGYSGTLLLVLVLLGLGIAMFPVLGGSVIMIILSLLGLIGKGFEIAALWDHLKHAIKDYKEEKGKGSEALPNLSVA